MATKARAREAGERLLGAFLRAGAAEVTPDLLQPADDVLAAGVPRAASLHDLARFFAGRVQ